MAWSKNQIGHLLYDLDDHAAAETYAREALAIARKHWGDDHLLTTSFSMLRAWILIETGELDEAESLQRSNLEIRRADLERLLSEHDVPPAHFEVLLGQLDLPLDELNTHLADLDTRMEDLETRLAAQSDTPPIIRQKINLMGRTRRSLGVCLTKMGRFEEAEKQLHVAHRVQEDVDRGHRPDALRTLADLYEAWGKRDQAIAWLEQLETRQWERLQSARDAHGSDHSFVGSRQGELGETLTRLGKCEQAEQELLEADRILRLHVSPDHPRVRRTTQALVDLKTCQDDSLNLGDQ